MQRAMLRKTYPNIVLLIRDKSLKYYFKSICGTAYPEKKMRNINRTDRLTQNNKVIFR